MRTILQSAVVIVSLLFTISQAFARASPNSDEWQFSLSPLFLWGMNIDGYSQIGPNIVAPDRYVYYPGTEVLEEDEVRVVACGTGMPDQRRAQASACFLFEFGNGEKIIFDIGSGSMRNIAALMIPYEYLTKIFLSHLHTDHWRDLASLWVGGWTAGRTGPLKIWYLLFLEKYTAVVQGR